MSFSSQVKEELNSIHIKSNCCKKAYIFGAVLTSDVIDGVIHMKLSDPSTAEHFCNLLKTIYKIEPERKQIKRGCYCTEELRFSSSKLTDFIKFADMFSDSEEDNRKLNSFFSCNSCKQIFLRGVFCAKGSVSNPQKTYTLEIQIPNDTRALLLHSVLEEIGPEAPGITERKGVFGVYYRNEGAIEYILSVCGLNKTIFTLIDVLIEKNLRNEENRANNCVIRNIKRSVIAASAHIEAIEALMSNDMLAELTEEIQTTAKLRLENPDMSLEELASIHIPPISKSGLNHRLSKITELAKKRKLI